MKWLKELFQGPERKALKDYSDEELRDFLENNSHLSASFLVFICSEVLRRMKK